ncbi:MAG: 16S rRNA (uracil(1498)-N(3))-methyltransferase [Caulobacteraceae bacterium]
MIRLHVSADLRDGADIVLSRDQSHYLLTVMRQQIGAEVLVFNGRDGEWRARLTSASKREARLSTGARIRVQTGGPDLDLVVALVKRPRLETIVEKAAELGARRLRLIITERTNAGRASLTRLAAIATEAAEQTGRLDVPVILAPERLDTLLEGWAPNRRLMFCDEAGEAPPALAALLAAPAGPWAVLIGPEGGFSPAEREAIRILPSSVPVALGPRILRTDSAAIAALALWQAVLGDWRGA